MYKKKEILIIILIMIAFLIFCLYKNEDKKSEIVLEDSNEIIIDISGEVIKNTQLIYYEPVTYGSIFLKIKNILNMYSDISSFNYKQIIDSSLNLIIPTKDINNNYEENYLVNINTSSQEELKKLPQIGDKRSEKIIEYREQNGRIDTWDILWGIIGVSDEIKAIIMEQAIL